MDSISMMKQTRGLIHSTVSQMSIEALLAIPPGHRNNALWNLGHIVVSQQLLNYGRCGLDLLVPDELVVACRRDTHPGTWTTPPDVNLVLDALIEHPERLEEDYRAGLFQGFEPMVTSTGISINTVEESITFAHFHDGIHTGVIMAQAKTLRLARERENGEDGPGGPMREEDGLGAAGDSER